MKIPARATLCGVILSSNKTHITNVCGGRVTHPLLISLANIKMDVRNNGFLHAFLLLALMPIEKFTHPVSRMHSVLSTQLFHQCLNTILKPLKQVARIGRMMSDPARNLRYCFIPLVLYIVNMLEACMLTCVHINTSPITTAMYKNISNPDCHQPCTTATTLNQLASIKCNVNDVDGFFAACEPFWLRSILDDIWAPTRKARDFFDVAARLSSFPHNSIPTPLHTFVAGSTAIHSNYEVSCKHVPVDNIAEMFELPDLHGALADYLHCEQDACQNLHTFGGQRRSLSDTYLLLQNLHV